MQSRTEHLSQLINAALGRIEPDLILRGGMVYNVFTHTLMQADVAVKNGVICGVGDYDGVSAASDVDVSGCYLLPGFIDAHVHIESSMVTPAEYARAVLPHGVTTVVADPHEIANVCGKAGLDYMKAAAAGVPLDVRYMLPSCVPCASFAPAGASLTAADTQRLAPDFCGIGEMMNYPGLLACDPEVLGKLVEGKTVDGHAPMVSGRELNAYLSTGIRTDHECSTPDELRERTERGMYVLLREGTLSKDVRRLAEGITPANAHRCLFCTDDRHIGEILREGTIDYSIRLATEHGVALADAINMATFNAAQCYGLRCGAIAPSYAADILVSGDLMPHDIRQVYKAGVLVAEHGKALFDAPHTDAASVTGTVHLDPVNPTDFAHERDASLPVIELLPDIIITARRQATEGDRLTKVCVLERHHRTGQRGFAYIYNYGVTQGAIASSVGHDSHNIIVAGDNDADMALAVNALGHSGGIAVCSQGQVLASLTLDIAGLMSSRPAEAVAQAHERLHQAARRLGVAQGIDPFLSLAFLPLPVIPALRVTERGLFDVEQWKFLS